MARETLTPSTGFEPPTMMSNDQWPGWMNDLVERKQPQEIGAYGTVVLVNARDGEMAIGVVLEYGEGKGHYFVIPTPLANDLGKTLTELADGLDE